MKGSRTTKVGVVLVAWLVLLPMHATCNEPKAKLLESIAAYHHAEEEGLWGKVYELRTAGFKRQVAVNDFVSAMAEASSGWALLAFQVQDTTRTTEGVRVYMRFVERPPEQFWEGMGVSPRTTLTLDEEALWVMEHGAWRIREAPTRAHLPFAR